MDRARPLALVVALVLVALGLASCEGIPTEFVSGTQTLGLHTIPEGAQMVFDPNVSSTLIMTGSLVVEGTLRMRPANPDVVHKIIFSTADESAFHGSTPAPDNPCAPLTPACYDSDEGLWVVNGGRLDISGAVKEPWGRATGALAAGATSLTLDRPATGWHVNDEIAIAPTASGDYTHEICPPSPEDRTLVCPKVTSVTGNEVSFSPALNKAYPSVALPDGTVTTAEVLNLTRNVDIEGKAPATPFPRDVQPPPPPNNNGHGRSHIFIQNNTPVQQTIDYTAIRYMGPRQVNTRASSDFVLGRYGLHFHMSGDNNRGTVVTGSVVRDTGSHAFVPHMSNGITFHRTIALDTVETAYWWDVKANEEANLNNDPTDDIHYEETVAGGISVDPFRGSIRPAGYSAACGARNQIVGAVAFGVQAAVQSTGIVWPEGANACSNNWAVGSTIVHNNNGAGLFTWQNDTEKHGLINGVVAYRNGGACLDHGAYRNRFDYSNIECFDNSGKWISGAQSAQTTEVVLKAHSEGSNPSQLNDFVIRGPHVVNALRIYHDRADTPSNGPTTLRRWDVGGYSGAAVRITEVATTATGSPPAPEFVSSRGEFDFVCWTLPGGAELTPANIQIDRTDPVTLVTSPVSGVYRVQPRNPALQAYEFLPDGTTMTIDDFATC